MVDDINGQLWHAGIKLAEEQGIPDLLGSQFRILARRDAQRGRVVFSFRSAQDQSADDVGDGWVELKAPPAH